MADGRGQVEDKTKSAANAKVCNPYRVYRGRSERIRIFASDPKIGCPLLFATSMMVGANHKLLILCNILCLDGEVGPPAAIIEYRSIKKGENLADRLARGTVIWKGDMPAGMTEEDLSTVLLELAGAS